MARWIAILAPIVLLLACAPSPEPELSRLSETPVQGEVPSADETAIEREASPASETPAWKEESAATDAVMIHALDAWRRYDMPSPPAEAELVWLKEVGVSGSSEPWDGFAFLIGHANSGRLHLHDGTHEYTRRYCDIKTVDAELREQPRSYGSGGGVSLFRYPRRFAIGLHAHERGHHDLGRQLVSASLGKNFNSNIDHYRQPNGYTVHDMLGVVVWGYWFNQVVEGGADRHSIHAMLARAVDEFASLSIKRARLDLLGTSIAPSKAEPGSPEELVETLMEVPFRLSDFMLRSRLVDEPIPEPLIRLLQAGFDVVPALLAHEDDPRLTRTVLSPSTSRPFAFTLGRLAMTVLDMMSDWRLSYRGMSRTSNYARSGWPERWWANTSGLDEEQYFASLLAPERLRDISRGYDPLAAALVLGHKYPDTLRDCIVKVLYSEHSGHVFRLLSVLPHSSLSVDRKADLLELAAMSLDYDGNTRAVELLQQLHELDPQAFARLFVEMADHTERGLDGNCGRGRRIVDFARVAQLSADADVWAALARLTKRSVPDLQVRIVNVMQADDRSAIAFLADFVEEEEPSEGQLARVAGERLAKILEFSPPGDQAWRDFYATLKAALAQHGIQPGGQ